MTALLEQEAARPPQESSVPTTMRIRKRNGALEPADLNKILRAIGRCCEGLDKVDAVRVATKTISGVYNGASTKELDELSIQTAAGLTAEEPQYSRLAARLLSTCIDKEVENQGIHSFSQSLQAGLSAGLIGERLWAFAEEHRRKLDDAVEAARTEAFEYFGLRTLYDRYLLRHPQTRAVMETPQHFFLRIACALSESVAEALKLYGLLSRLEYLPSSPTLFNAGTCREQLSSCFLLDSPGDDLASIYDRYKDVALLSKWSGGIGLAFHRVRSRGSLIQGTNGHSNGIVPWLKTLDASVAAVNQGGKRKGAACVYLEPWHADIEAFLELRDNTGDPDQRAHHLNLANWIPDLFMRRVEQDAAWSLFDPKVAPALCDLWGEAFDQAYEAAESAGLAARQVPARELYGRMMRTLAQTGNGWMCFKDASNRACNQIAQGGAVHLSNLCTEILERTSSDETAVCNLGSINLSRHVGAGGFDFDKLAETVRSVVPQLDRVIDRNLYPIETAKAANLRWRPVGLGVMGMQDVFFQLRLPFDSEEAKTLSTRIAEEIYFHALSVSVELAERHGAHPGFPETWAAQGLFHFEHADGRPSDMARWETLRSRMVQHGLRNSLLIAIAPTATIASLAGCSECIEPAVSNLFKRETLSGDFLQVNRHLVKDLQALGLWNEPFRDALKQGEGSVQGLDIPEELKRLYRTAWELPMKALIDIAAARLPYIDQSQSLNLFMETPTIARLSSMYFYAWKAGLKTTYYLRSRPATRIAKATVGEASTAEAISCSLENPESCEACQ